MKKSKSSEQIIKFIYAAVVILIAVIIGAISVRVYINKQSEALKLSEIAFERTYNISEERIKSLKNISRLLFESDCVKYFGRSEGSYNYLQIQNLIKSYQDVFNCFNNQIIITDLRSEYYISAAGTDSLSNLSAKLTADLSDPENFNMNEIKFGIDRDAHLLNLIFGYEYYDTKERIFCIVISDISNFIPDSYDSSRTEMTGVAAAHSERELFKRPSLYVKNLEYLYFYNSKSPLRILCLAFVLLCCLLPFIFSRKIAGMLFNLTYMPVIKLMEQLGYKKAADEQWDSFVNRLVKSNEIQLQKLNETKISLRKLFIKNLIFGVKDITAADWKKYNLSDLNVPCRAAVICGKFENSGEFTANLELVMNKICRGEFIYLSNSQCIFITGDTDINYLSEKLVRVLDFADLYNIQILISVGKTVGSIEQIHDSYKNANDNCEKISVSAESSIVFSEKMPENNDDYYYPIDIEISLIENTILGNADKVNEILSELIEINFCSRLLDTENIREFKIMLTGTVNRILKQINKQACDIFGDNAAVYLEISALRDMNETVANIRRVFDRLCLYAKNSNTTKQEQLARGILDFIKQNYKNPEISLVMIAEHFLISQVHVRRMINLETDKGYKEYLDNLRIEDAKKLLTSTEMKVNAVAEEVGYTNVRTFIRVFEKRTGMSPGEYRLGTKKV